MKIAIIIARVILGGIFLVFGLNGFLHFIDVGPMPTGAAGDFLGALIDSGYLNVIKVLEIIGGLLILVGRGIPLGLVILGPIVFNILFYHILMTTAGLPMAIVLLVAECFLIWAHKESFAPIFKF